MGRKSVETDFLCVVELLGNFLGDFSSEKFVSIFGRKKRNLSWSKFDRVRKRVENAPKLGQKWSKTQKIDFFR